MSKVVITLDGKPVARSKNLRVILDYARVHPVRYVQAARKTDLASGLRMGATVIVRFDDGAYCVTDFADFTVAREWINSRRSWALRRMFDTDGFYRAEAPTVRPRVQA